MSPRRSLPSLTLVRPLDRNQIRLKVIAFDGGTLLHQFDWPAISLASPAGRQRVKQLSMC